MKNSFTLHLVHYVNIRFNSNSSQHYSTNIYLSINVQYVTKCADLSADDGV